MINQTNSPEFGGIKTTPPLTAEETIVAILDTAVIHHPLKEDDFLYNPEKAAATDRPEYREEGLMSDGWQKIPEEKEADLIAWLCGYYGKDAQPPIGLFEHKGATP